MSAMFGRIRRAPEHFIDPSALPQPDAARREFIRTSFLAAMGTAVDNFQAATPSIVDTRDTQECLTTPSTRTAKSSAP